MPASVEVYRAVAETEELSSGDIAFLSLVRTRVAGETPPGETFDPVGRIPAYPKPGLMPLPYGREVAIDTMFALVVTHSCEIDRQRNQDVEAAHFDCRLTVAPIVPEPAVTLIDDSGRTTDAMSWAAIERNDPVNSLYLPSIDSVAAYAPGVEQSWPRAFADLRGLVTVSRGMVRADRLFGLTPAYLGILQRQLARFFTWRDLARHEVLEAMAGRRIEAVVPLNPKSGRWRLALTADDGSSVTIEVRIQGE